MKKTILICGKAESGKDEVAKYLEKELLSKKQRVLIFPITYFFKELLKRQYGWNGKKDKKGRTLLQEIGEKYNNASPCLWAKMTGELLHSVVKDYDFFIITGVRRKVEIEHLKKQFKAVAIQVQRPKHKNKLTAEQNQHITETDLDDFVFDHVIENDEDNSLKTKTTQLLNTILV